MRGRSTFSLHNWKMLSKKFSLLFFLSPGWDWFDRGSTQQGTNYVSLSIVTDGVSPVLPLSFSLLFIRNNILYKNPAEGREWRTKRQKKNWTRRCQDSPWACGITGDNKAMLFFLLVSSNAKINSVIHIITD